jgi:type VI secretion system protein ImpG
LPAADRSDRERTLRKDYEAGEFDEDLWPPAPTVFRGFQWLHEYFAFPWKFLFVDLVNLHRLRQWTGTTALDLLFSIPPLRDRTNWQEDLDRVSVNTFRLGCTPAVNLFEARPDPIRLEQTAYEYRVPHEPNTEIYSIQSVVQRGPQSAGEIVYRPFYEVRAADHRGGGQPYWYARRSMPLGEHDGPVDWMIALVNGNGKGSPVPGVDALTVGLLCTNGDLPVPPTLTYGDESGDFSLERGAGITKVVAVVQPKRRYSAPTVRGDTWHLISQLALGHASLVDYGPARLRWLMELNNLTQDKAVSQYIEAVLDVRSAPSFARVETSHGPCFVRGKRVIVTVDEDRFAGSGVFLFGALLERFLGSFTAVNSFTQLKLQTKKFEVAEWPPRTGSKVLV